MMGIGLDCDSFPLIVRRGNKVAIQSYTKVIEDLTQVEFRGKQVRCSTQPCFESSSKQYFINIKQTFKNIYIHIYIYIYILSLRKTTKPVTCFPITRKKINRTSSDLFLSKRSKDALLIFFFVFLEISKMRNRMEINL